VRKLRVAVVGAGRLGGFHARKLARCQGAELVAVVDPVASSRNRVAAECGAEAMADCGPLLGQIDAAVVAVPTRCHHAVALELLNWGIHLLVEKPLCATAVEADGLVEAARRNGAVLQVGHVERFNPAMTAAIPHIVSPKYIEAVRAGGFTFRSTDIGVVLDLMIHDLDLVLRLVHTPVRRIEALGLSVLGGHEDVANARVEFECGCVASLNASRIGSEPVRRMHVWSARGFAAIDFAARKTTLVHPSESLLRRQLDVAALAADESADRERFLEEHLRREEAQFDAVDALALELEDFLESIRAQRSPQVTGEDGRDAVALAERILRKIQTHAWDDQTDGPVGPLAIPRPTVVPTPHFTLSPAEFPVPRREAG
jgi:predicted dehydrogenase